MRHLLLAISAFLLFSTTTLLHAQGQNSTTGIDVTASVNRDVTPDEIFLSITITEQESKGKTTAQEQEKQMIKALKKLDIDVDKNLTIDNMTSSLQTYFLKKDNILENKRYTLKLSTAEETAATLEALNNIGISKVSITKTSISDELEESVRRELLREATIKTKENATILADAAGCRVGTPFYMENYSSHSSRVAYSSNTMLLKSRAGADSIEESANANIQISKINISTTVKCIYAILH